MVDLSLAQLTVFSMLHHSTVKPVLSGHSKEDQKFGFHDRLLLNAGQKYCRLLLQVNSIAECSPLEHSAILFTFIELPFVIKSFVLSIFEWSLKIGFTVCLFDLTVLSIS